MKNYKNLILIFVFLIVATNFGCSAVGRIKDEIDKTQTPQTVQCTDGSCELIVPGSWKIQKDLNEQANFQFANPLAEQYAIVISESKIDFTKEMNLDGYAELIQQGVRESIQNPVISETKTIAVGGRPALQFEVGGSVSNIKANWIYTLVDTPGNYHQILVWSTASRFEKNKPVLLEVVNSFKEINKTSAPTANAQ